MHTVNCVQVQSTNDASTISKYSTANKNYIKDDFIQCFVNKNHSRASLIHLGYYARMIIFHKVVVNFIEQMRHRNLQKFQIISCGSGFDTTYWRLSESNLLRKEDLFVEIDFLPVIEKKIKIIDQSEKLKAYLNNSFENNSQKSAAKQLNSNYFLLAADLSNTNIIEGLLNNIKIDYNCPTLFLSECVITYMKLEDSDNLIKWMSKKFSNCTFINYEQIHPYDGFGTVLMRHFNKLQSPLFSVTRYPDCDSHIKRYKNLGFENALAFSEWEVLRSLTTESEHENVITLEQFDEFEEFHLKCVHYVVAISSKGSLNNGADCFNLEMKKFRTDFREILSWKRIPTALELYGHVSCKIGNKIILFGGVTRRQRSSRIYEVTENSHSHFANFNSKEIDLDMVHGSCCHFIMKDKHYVCLFGGRKSPNKICNEEKAAVLEYDGAGFILKELIPLPSMMVPRYRSSLVCQYEDSEKISLWIFGGRAADLKIGLPDIWRLEITLNETGNFSYEWTHLKEDGKSKPCSRISPSAVACNTNALMYLSGGLKSHSFTVLNDIWKFCFINKTWCQIHLKSGTLLPRYGHTSHVINDILYLVGGTNTFAEAQPGLAVINLKSLSVIEYAIPTNDIHPFLFFNHNSQLIQDEDSDDAILVVGGGGNCFSFGTYLNDSMQVIKLKQFF